MENDGNFKDSKNGENDFNKNKNRKSQPFVNKEHPLYEQYKEFLYLDDDS